MKPGVTRAPSTSRTRLAGSATRPIFAISRFPIPALNGPPVILPLNSTGWQPLVAIIGGVEQFEESYNEYTERTVVRFLLSDAGNPGSMISSLEAARENARTVRDYLPREVWQLINETYLYAGERAVTISG